MNNTRDNNNNLYNSSGQSIGKVQIDGSVRDGYRERGKITDNGRYVDEYGRDQGWVVNGASSNSSSGGELGGLAGLLLLGLFSAGIYWVYKWVVADPKRKQVGTTILIIYGICFFLAIIFAVFIQGRF